MRYQLENKVLRLKTAPMNLLSENNRTEKDLQRFRLRSLLCSARAVLFPTSGCKINCDWMERERVHQSGFFFSFSLCFVSHVVQCCFHDVTTVAKATSRRVSSRNGSRGAVCVT